MNISSALLLGSLCRVMLGDLMVKWVNILCGQSSQIEPNIHCSTSVVGAFALSVFLVHLETLLLLFSKQQEYLLSARSFVYCLSILGWFGYLPICSQYSLCFANPQGFNSFSPGKYHRMAFCTHCGFCQNLMHGGPKTSKSWNALQQGPLERYVVQPPY